MDICKCIVPSRHGGTLNSRRAASPLERLVEGEERREASDPPQGVLPLNWGGTEPNRIVTYMVLKATVNDRRHLALAMMNFVALDLTFADQRNWSKCWTKPSNCDADLSSLDATRNDPTHLVTPLILITGGLCAGSNGSRSPITNRSTTNSVCYASFGVRSYHSQQNGMSVRRLLLCLPLTGNHMRLRHQWCDERWTWNAEWNDIGFTDEFHFFLQHHDGRIRVWRHRGERLPNCCVMHIATLVLHPILWFEVVLDFTVKPL
ncbi:uncharacterized protein TNCV_1153781 [Trichonephila clavipes]|nr:uncharacterized protein TNCV_1153781 [Trichonephila clavipes]